MTLPTVADDWKHSHAFDQVNPLAEKNTLRVVVLTAVMMVAEIIGGSLFHSMALLADGWHMSTHAFAMGVSVLAYAYARRFANHPRFAFGTWKVEVLGGYTSAMFLVLVAGAMLYQSVLRLMNPVAIQFDEAIAIAAVGLAVNLACAWLLKDGHHHEHDHDHHDHAHEHHHDLNLRSAYIHVIADASTSVLAIVALTAGKFWGANWLDPIMGIVGAALISVWAYGLIRDTAKALVDADMMAPVVGEIREAIAAAPVRTEIRDLHVWRVGKGKFACILSLACVEDVQPDYFRKLLGIHEELVHVTVELSP